MTDLATVLIVDDEKHTRDGLRLALEDDFDCYVASNAAEAMEHLKNDQVDVMLTDLRLGDDDGMKLLEPGALVEIEATAALSPEIPVPLQTGAAE